MKPEYYGVKSLRELIQNCNIYPTTYIRFTSHIIKAKLQIEAERTQDIDTLIEIRRQQIKLDIIKKDQLDIITIHEIEKELNNYMHKIKEECTREQQRRMQYVKIKYIYELYLNIAE